MTCIARLAWLNHDPFLVTLSGVVMAVKRYLSYGNYATRLMVSGFLTLSAMHHLIQPSKEHVSSLSRKGEWQGFDMDLAGFPFHINR